MIRRKSVWKARKRWQEKNVNVESKNGIKKWERNIDCEKG